MIVNLIARKGDEIDLAIVELSDGPGARRRGIDAEEDALDLRMEHLALGGRNDPVPPPMKQREAAFALQQQDQLADGRLDRCSFSAARVKLPNSMMVLKASNCRMFIDAGYLRIVGAASVAAVIMPWATNWLKNRATVAEPTTMSMYSLPPNSTPQPPPTGACGDFAFHSPGEYPFARDRLIPPPMPVGNDLDPNEGRL